LAGDARELCGKEEATRPITRRANLGPPRERGAGLLDLLDDPFFFGRSRIRVEGRAREAGVKWDIVDELVPDRAVAPPFGLGCARACAFPIAREHGEH